MADAWADIRQRLAVLAADPAADRVFGRHGHHWVLEPPHTEAFNPADGFTDPPDEADFDSEEAYTADDGGFRPLLDDDGTPLGFARWYRRWLDAAAAA
jgi:hypothetical protein